MKIWRQFIVVIDTVSETSDCFQDEVILRVEKWLRQKEKKNLLHYINHSKRPD